MRAYGKSPKFGIQLQVKNAIPISRGLGSSAAATVAGSLLGLQLSGRSWDNEDLIQNAAVLEGHWDNVVPCVLGGLTACLRESDRCVMYKRLPMNLPLKIVAIVPEATVSTSRARRILPSKVSHKTAVRNLMGTAFLVSSLMEGDMTYLKESLWDGLHQPYRLKLITGLSKLFKTVSSTTSGAYLSGSGPAIIAFYRSQSEYESLAKCVQRSKLNPKLLPVTIDHDGCQWHEG